MSGIFGFNEAAAVAGIGTFCAWQFTRYPFRKSTIQWYMRVMGRTNWDRMLFGVPMSWLLETALLTITFFYFWQTILADSWQMIAGTVLLITYTVLIKVRYLQFWEMRDPRMAYFTSWALLLIGGAIYAPLIAGTRETPAVPPMGFVLEHQPLWWVAVLTHSIHFAGIFFSFIGVWFFWRTHYNKFKRHSSRGKYNDDGEYRNMDELDRRR